MNKKCKLCGAEMIVYLIENRFECGFCEYTEVINGGKTTNFNPKENK